MGLASDRLRVWAPTALVLLAFVWLMSNVPLVAVPNALNDDGLLVRRAGYILAGAWLGPYNNVVLSKGPAYSLWIAASWIAGLPLLVSQAILYATCCQTMVRALRPWLRTESMAFAALLLLLFNPVTYSDAQVRVVREGLYAPLTVLLLALFVWWWRLRDATPFRRASLAGGTGLLLGLYWCTREEGVWILPIVLIAVALPGAVSARLRGARASLLREAVVILALVVPALAVVGGFALMNRIHYGIATVVDIKQPEFLDAYDAFVRIQSAEPPTPYVIVSRAQRERAYAVSPAAAEMRENLDGPALDGLVNSGCLSHRVEPCDGELRAGWFVWALRYGAARQGYYASAESARTFYARLAAEIDTACRDGRVTCRPARRTLAPKFRWEFVPATFKTAGKALGFMASQDGLAVPRNPMSCAVDDCGQELMWPLFLDLVHSATLFVPPSPDELPRRAIAGLPPKIGLNDFEIAPGQRPLPFQLRAEMVARLLEKVIALYRLVMPYFLGLALAAYLAGAALSVARRRIEPLLAVATAAALVVALRILLLAYIDVTSFPAINTLYLSPAYPALLVFGLAAILGFAFTLRPYAR